MDSRDKLVRDVFRPRNAEYGVFFNRMESGFEHLANMLRLFLREENQGCMDFLMELFRAPNPSPSPETTPPGDNNGRPEDISLGPSEVPDTW